MTDIGDMIRYHRKRAGLSRVDLATIAGVGKTVIYDIEHGKEPVQFRALARVLDALNISLSFDSPLMSTYLKEHDATR